MAISMLKIRRPLGRLIFNMGITIPGKTVFLIETAPWLSPAHPMPHRLRYYKEKAKWIPFHIAQAHRACPVNPATLFGIGWPDDPRRRVENGSWLYLHILWCKYENTHQNEIKKINTNRKTHHLLRWNIWRRGDIYWIYVIQCVCVFF